MIANDNSYDIYLKDITKFPRISAEREAELSIIISRGKRKKAVEKAVAEMVEANLRLVLHCLKEFRGYLKSPDVALSIMDLVAEGNIALMNAARKFNVEYTAKGAGKKKHKSPIRFSSYACKSIKCAMRRAVRLAKFIHIPENHFSYWAKINALQGEYNKPLSDKMVSRRLDISVSKLEKLKTSRQSRTARLEDLMPDDASGDWADIIPDTKGLTPEKNMENKDLKQCLLCEMKQLPERTGEMLQSMFFSEKLPTLGDLSDRFGVSKERCRQICARGLEMLRQQLEGKWTMTGDLEAFGFSLRQPAAVPVRPARRRAFISVSMTEPDNYLPLQLSEKELLEEACVA